MSLTVLKCMDMIKTFENLQSLDRLKYLNKTLCEIHLAEYLNSLKSEQYWALQMFDSSPKAPYSLLTGNRKVLGNYDECVEVEHPDHLFTGQHCLLSMNITVDLDKTTPEMVYLDEKQATRLLQYSICVPSTCTPKDITNIFNNTMNDTLSESSLALNQDDCQVKNSPRQLRLIDWIAIAILISFGIIALSSTFYDIYQNYFGNTKPHPLLISFSIYSNGKNLFRINKNSEHMKALDGLRVLSISWIVLLHANNILGAFSINPLKQLANRKDPREIGIIYGPLAVDTFLVLSGMLVCVAFFRSINKKGYYDVPVQFIHRYIRLTPSYAAVALIIVSIFIFMGDGPLWISTSKPFSKPCEKNWWGGITYLSTLINIPGGTCNPPTWYIATDMQLYFFSPLILIPLYLWPSFAIPFLGMIILASASTTFGIAYFYDLDASIQPMSRDRSKKDYIRFYSRSSPYLIGIALGYIITQIRAGKITIKLKKVFVIAGWFMAIIFGLGVLYGILPFQISKHSTLESSLYISFHRLAWGFSIAWIVLACLNGYGGIVNKFLSWSFFQLLSKLSYNVYLLHWMVIIYKVGSMRTYSYLGNTEIFFGMLSYVMLTNLLAIPFTLLFEMPFGNLDSYFFQNVKIFPYPKKRVILQQKEKEMEEPNVPAEGYQKKNASE